jgi:hypothetical protein
MHLVHPIFITAWPTLPLPCLEHLHYPIVEHYERELHSILLVWEEVKIKNMK